MTNCRVELSHDLPLAARESPSIVVVIHISVDHLVAKTDEVAQFRSPDDNRWRPVTSPRDSEFDAQPSRFTDSDVGPTRHHAEVELTDEPAAVTRTRSSGGHRRVSTSRSRNGWCTLTVVAAAAVIGAAVWIPYPAAHLTGALAAAARQPLAEHAAGLSGPGATTSAP